MTIYLPIQNFFNLLKESFLTNNLIHVKIVLQNPSLNIKNTECSTKMPLH